MYRSNRQAIHVLAALVLGVAVIFFAEKKFLLRDRVKDALEPYSGVSWISKVVLLIEDFESLRSDSSAKAAGLFDFGNAEITIGGAPAGRGKVGAGRLASASALRVKWKGNESYGGWGKGVGANFDLNALKDHLGFRIFVPAKNGGEDLLRITMEEDDDRDGVLKKEKDDAWVADISIKPKEQWQFISIPLSLFRDDNDGGDGILNVSESEGLHTVVFSFLKTNQYTADHEWYFDFICFTSGNVNEE